MIDRDREKELERLFDEYKRDMKSIERIVRLHNLPTNFIAVMQEQIEHRLIDKALNDVLYREDQKLRFQQRAENLKAYYDTLIKKGFDHDTAIDIICNTQGQAPNTGKPGQEGEEEE
jgi:hypothetical protein